MVESVRPSNRDMFDAGTIVRTRTEENHDTIKCMLEVKSSTKAVRVGINKALERQDSNANVSFIVVAGTLSRLRSFNLVNFSVRDRSVRVDDKFPDGISLTDSQLLKVQVDKTKRVTLTSLAKEKPEANRVIFVISMHDITALATTSQ